MISPFAALFIAIQQRLATILDVNSQQAIKFIDQDLSQLEDTAGGYNRPPVSWPCALIDIHDTSFTSYAALVQQGQVGVSIRLGFPPFSSTALQVPVADRNKALYYYDLEQAIVLALHGWTPGTVTIDDNGNTFDLSNIFGDLIRMRAVKEDRNDLLRVRCIYFTLPMEDHSTEEVQQYTSATPNFTIGLTD